jgi:hypothetical protein
MRVLSRSACAAVLACLTVVTAAPAGAAVPTAPPAGDPVYALVHGCYALRWVATGQFVAGAPGGGYRAATADAASAEGFRLQATALGRYLLYGRGRDFPAEAAGGGLGRVTTPGPSADFVVRTAGASAFTLATLGSGKRITASGAGGVLTLAGGDAAGPDAQFAFVPATGCQTFPELSTNTVGEPSKGKTPFGSIRGWLDSINHMMAFEFIGGSIHCGRPWSPYGAAVALTDCADHGPNGSTAAVENALSYGNPLHMHTPDGWPGFTGWPTAPSLTHEQVYWKWLERAWRGGQRLMGGVAVDNAQLCELYPLRRNPCDEMAVVRKEIQDFHDLQDYIDAQFGGPGKGFFRIVTDPFMARKVMNDGKLAVFLGMEISRPFGCRLLDDKPACDKAQIEREIQDLYSRGLRSSQLVNKFDNALVGVAGDGGPTGLVLNSGNRRETGHFWQLETCTTPGADKEQTTALGNDEANFSQGLALVAPAGVPAGAVPIYPPAPHCNVRGLTDLGETVLSSLMRRHMIIDMDHMSVRAHNQTLSYLEAARYSGIISTHGWSTPDAFRRIYALGGVVTPYAGGSTNFASEWKRNLGFKSSQYAFGFGIGSDIEGFGSQGNPRPDAAKNPVTYPFKGLDPAVTIAQGRSNTRGWVQDLRRIAGDGIVEDLAHGAENYVQMWERADGVPAEHCVPARQRMTAKGMGAYRLGDTHVALLKAAGQPLRRPDRTWTWCGIGRDGRPGGRVRTVLTPGGRLALVTSTGAEHRIAGIGRGSRASKLPKTTRLTATLRTAPAGGGRRFVYGVRGGRVTSTAIASSAISRSNATLRSYLRMAGLR